jgi:hypothetical protein
MHMKRLKEGPRGRQGGILRSFLSRGKEDLNRVHILAILYHFIPATKHDGLVARRNLWLPGRVRMFASFFAASRMLLLHSTLPAGELDRSSSADRSCSVTEVSSSGISTYRSAVLRELWGGHKC